MIYKYWEEYPATIDRYQEQIADRDRLIMKLTMEKHALDQKIDLLNDKITCLEARLKGVNNASQSS